MSLVSYSGNYHSVGLLWNDPSVLPTQAPSISLLFLSPFYLVERDSKLSLSEENLTILICKKGNHLCAKL